MCSSRGVVDGAPHTLLGHVRTGATTMVTSPAMLAELADVLMRAKFDAAFARSNISRERALTEVRRLAEVFDAAPLPRQVCRDPDDDLILALAIAAKVNHPRRGPVEARMKSRSDRIALRLPSGM